MSSQKVVARKVVSFVQDLNGLTSSSFEQKISTSFTPDEMFVRYLGLGSSTMNALTIKCNSLHADPLGSVLDGSATSPNTGFKLGYDISNTHRFQISDVAVTISAATYLAMTLEFVQYEKSK